MSATRCASTASREVEQHVGGDLIVAAAAGVQPPAGVADQLGEPALDGGVDVLVGRLDVEGPVTELGLDALEPVGDGPPVIRAEHPRRDQHLRVSPRAGDVLCPHARVDRKRGVQAVERVRRAAGEASAPQPRAVAHRATAAGSRVSTLVSARQTWSTWSSVISGKNGSAIVEALIASVTGKLPGR